MAASPEPEPKGRSAEDIDALMEEVEARMRALESANATSRKTLDYLNRQVDDAVDSLTDQQDKNTALEMHNEALQVEVKDLNTSASELEVQISRVKSESSQIIDQLRAEVEKLAAVLSLVREDKGKLAKELDLLSVKLDEAQAASEADRERIRLQLQDIAIMQSLRQELLAKLAEAETERDKQKGLSEEQKKLSDEAQAQLLILNRQIAALRQQLARLAVALEVAEVEAKKKDVQIADLGRRLNVALASKVQELARYRSEFFGRLREVLGERKDVRIVGDRFVFQSEVLFASGSAQLGEPGKEQLARLATTLTEIAAKIPPDLAWVLQVNGHTDRDPIHTVEFPSNWELSTARAVSVVNFLIEQGIAPEHLAATGFGEFQPLDPDLTDEAFRRNRRIELKLTSR